MKTRLLVVAALATLVCASTVMSQGGGRQSGGRQGGPGGSGGSGAMSCPAMAVAPPQAAMLERFSESLELTDEQTTQLTEVMTKGDKTARTLQEKAVKATKALKTALLAADFDVVKVKELSTAAQKAEADLITASIDEWVKIRAILSDTQLTALQKAMTPPARGTRGQGGPRGEGGPPPEAEGGPPPSDEF